VALFALFAGDDKLNKIHVGLALLVYLFSLFSLFGFSPFFNLLSVLFSFLFFSPYPPLPFFSCLFCFLTPSTFFVCVCVSVCIFVRKCVRIWQSSYLYLRMYVRAYLAIPCVSANDNVENIQSNIRYVSHKKINNMK